MWGVTLWGTGLWATSGPAQLVPDQAFSIKIDGVDVTSFCAPETYRREGGLNRRTMASFQLKDRTNTYRPAEGASVIVMKNGTRNFGGTIESSEELMIQSSSNARILSIQAVDYNQILDKRLIVRNFEVAGQTAGDIVRLIIDEFLAEEGIVPGAVEDGIEVDKAIFNYTPASTSLDELAQLGGMSWFVDNFKALNFISRTSTPASIILTDTNEQFRDLKRITTRDDYANFVYLRGGTSLSDPQNENFAGDNERQTFNVGLPIDQTPTILLNSVAQTVGIKGVDDDTAFQWFFSKSKTEITQRLTDTPLAPSDTLETTYVGQFPLIVAGQLPAEIAERALAEGNSGKYEHVEDNDDIDERTFAVETVDGILRKFGDIPTKVTFQRDNDDIISGQLITISLSEENIVGDFLVTDVTYEEKDHQNRSIYTIQATSGELVGNWVEWFRKLKKQGKRFAIRENEILEVLRFQAETVTVTDSLNTITALDDGTNDPYTGLPTGFDADDIEFAHFIGLTNIGKDQP